MVFLTQSAFTCSKLIIETLEQGMNIFKITIKTSELLYTAILMQKQNKHRNSH